MNETIKNYLKTGVFKTENTKFGRFGYSMVVDGLDKGINNNAKQRAIIFHSNKLMKTSCFCRFIYFSANIKKLYHLFIKV